MTGVVEVENLLGNCDFASTGLAQFYQGDRIERKQRYMPGDFIVTLVALEIVRLHALEIELQPLAGQQPLLQTVPISELNEVRVTDSHFMSIGLFGALGDVVGEPVTLEVQGRDLPSHPVVEFAARILLAQISVRLSRLFRLQIMILKLTLRDLHADLRRGDLP